jgi:cytochrome P450
MRAPHDVVTDFRSSAWLDDPYADYAAWQRDTPVFRNQDGALYLTRHADCSALLGEARFRRRASAAATRPFEASTPLDAMLGQWMLFMDRPRHQVVRDAFAPLFAPHALERTEAAIRATVRDLIAPLRESARAEFVAAFASPLPVLVLCELLGLPPEDRPLLEDWSTTLTRALESGAASEMQSAVPASRAMRDYFAVRPCPSLPQLTADETLFGLAFLVWAGHETTRNLLASGVLALCEHPGEIQRWREDPGLVRRRHSRPGGVRAAAAHRPRALPQPAPVLRPRPARLPGCFARAPRSADRPPRAARRVWHDRPDWAPLAPELRTARSGVARA